MSIKIKDKRVRRFSFNHVDSELHASIHAKSPMYAIQHHEEYEQKALPVNSNSLQFKKVANEHLVACLYTDKDDITKASNEFKQNLILFYIYLTLYLSIFLGFSIAMHSEGLLPTSHLLIHLTVLLLLLLLSYLLLFLILHNCLLLKSPQLFLALGFCIYLYLIFADPRVLYKFTGEAYFDNHIPMVLGLITLIPMLRLVIFDSYIYIVLLVVASFVLYIIAQLAFSPLSRLATLSEIALVGVFSILQIIDSHRSDLRIKHIFWRREKETVVNKENNANAKFRNSSINSDVEVIMDSCDQIKKKLKYVTRIVMYSEVKKIIKENILEIEKIKWKVAHRQDVKVIIDPNIDEEDREYIQQNCVDLKYFKSEGHERVVTEVSEKSKRGIHLRYSMHDVENALSAFGKNWNFDIWFIYNSTGESVGVIGKYLFSKWQINESFLIPTETTENYFKALEKAYLSNPYHNSCHSADVLHSYMFFILNSYLLPKLTPVETIGSIIGILGHDVGHPGLTNRFLINIKHDLALEYNDNSVLENMHCSTIYSLMKNENCDILSSVGLEEWFKIRNLIVTMVLATDMSKHFELLGQFRARVIGLKDLEMADFDDKVLALTMGIKCADLGHCAKSIDLHCKWSFLVIDELFAQGDLEKEKNLSVSMYCDRETTDIDKSQAGFLKNICMPLYEVWGLYLNSEIVENACIQQLASNQKYWEDRGKFRKSTMRISHFTDESPAIKQVHSQLVIN